MDDVRVFLDLFADNQPQQPGMLLFRLVTLANWLLAIVLLVSGVTSAVGTWKMRPDWHWLPTRIVAEVPSPQTQDVAPDTTGSGDPVLVSAQVEYRSPGLLTAILLVATALLLIWVQLPACLPVVESADPAALLRRHQL